MNTEVCLLKIERKTSTNSLVIDELSWGEEKDNPIINKSAYSDSPDDYSIILENDFPNPELPFITFGEEDVSNYIRRFKNKQASDLISEWLNEDSNYDKKTLPLIEKFLDKNKFQIKQY